MKFPSLQSSLFCLLFAVLSIPCFAFVSIGYLSEERASELGLKLSSKQTKSGILQINVRFKTDGELKVFSEAKRGNRIELQIGDPEKPDSVAPLQEDRSEAGQLSVSFSIDPTQIEKASVWIIRPRDGIADVIRLKDFVDVEKISTEAPQKGSTEAEQGGANQPASAPEPKPEGKEKLKPESEERPQ